MSDSEAVRFIEDIQSNSEFAEKLTKLRPNPDAVFNYIKSQGYDVTTEEISNAYLEFASSCMTEDQLQSVAAGLSKEDKSIIAGSVIAGTGVAAVSFGVTIAVITTASTAAAAAL